MRYHTVRLQGQRDVPEAVALLQRGECVALPTETVYGLAAMAAQDEAVSKIFAAKNRPADHPLIVHLPSAAHMEDWAMEIPDTAWRLAEQYWPGPLTLLLKKKPGVSGVVTGGLATIGLRVPAHPLFLSVLQALDAALAAPSANPYKQLSPTSAAQVLNGLDGRIAAVLDGGSCEFGLESTIVDLISMSPTVLRSGPVSRAALAATLGTSVLLPDTHDVAVPGNVAAHYKPRTPLRCVTRAELLAASGHAFGLLIWSDDIAAELDSGASARVRRLPDDPAGYGQGLYRALAEFDQLNLPGILVEAPPALESWAAVNDRLRRACG